MKRLIFLLFALLSTHLAYSQNEILESSGCISGFCYYPPIRILHGVTAWCGIPIDTLVKNADVILEGKILTDSTFHYENQNIASYNRVLVLKEFKGVFTSDTITILLGKGTRPNIGEVAFIIASYEGKTLVESYGYLTGYITVCDKKDIEKQIYEVIENTTGRKRIEVHPAICKTEIKPVPKNQIYHHHPNYLER